MIIIYVMNAKGALRKRASRHLASVLIPEHDLIFQDRVELHRILYVRPAAPEMVLFSDLGLGHFLLCRLTGMAARPRRALFSILRVLEISLERLRRFLPLFLGNNSTTRGYGHLADRLRRMSMSEWHAHLSLPFSLNLSSL
jgi:hypothetical protein